MASDADVMGVEAAVRMYIDSWHRGDADGMARSLHVELVKRAVDRDAPVGSGAVVEVTRSEMVEWTGQGGGGSSDAPVEIVVQHVEGDIASARVGTPDYLDYVHLVRTASGWRIVNDLYRRRSL
jgi:hypothetical protein